MRPRSVTDTIAETECWWTISGGSLLDLLRRAHNGEDPYILYAQTYVATVTEHEPYEPNA